MVMRPFDAQGTKLLISERIDTLRGGRPLPRGRRSPRPN